MESSLYTLTDGLPTPADYNRLRQKVAWGEYDESVIAAALPRSLYAVCAWAGEELVGMARVIGDGGLVYYIQDLIVLPEHQGRGIGSAMMARLMAYVAAHASPNTIVGLMAARGKEPFYERYGFTARPTERLGAGMTLFWRP
jgi:GNAT superfamily N-acetyltransferase